MIRQSETPLVLIAFNRPNLLRQQLEIVRESFNGSIYAIIDGPRAHRTREKEQVAEVVALIDELSKYYKIHINQSPDNLGCYRRIKSGLDWVFSEVDRAIILEDDCMPSCQFFSFAGEILEHYAEDDRVYSISGTNLFPEMSPPDQRYFFSRYHNCWGWATWARAWRGFIDSESEWREIRDSAIFRGTFRNYRSFWYWRRILDATYGGKINSWAYRWMLSCWMQSGLSVVFKGNLIKNIGGGSSATRTKSSSHIGKEIDALPSSIAPPVHAVANYPYDEAFEDTVFSKSVKNRLGWLFGKIIEN